MLEEDTGSTRHGKNIGITSLNIVADRILLLVSTAVLSIMILDKGHRVAAIIGLHAQALVGAAQVSPIIVVDRVTDGVTEGEVKRGTLHCAIHLCTVNPTLDCTKVTIPIFTHREFRLGIGIVHTRVHGSVALGHIVAVSGIAQVIEQHFQIGLYILLNVSATVIQVAHTAPVLTGIKIIAQALAVLTRPVLGGTTIIILADISR